MQRLTLFVFLVLLQFSAGAQSVTIGNLEEAVKLAFERNADFETYRLNQKTAQLQYNQSKSYRLPSISGSFNGQRNIDLATTPVPGEFFGQPGEVVDAQFGQDYTYNAGLTISNNLLDLEARLQKDLAGLKAEIAASDQQTFQLLLHEQVTLYYYTALVAKRAISIGEQDLENARELSRLTVQKLDEGLVDAMTVNSAKINAHSVEQNLIANRKLSTQCEVALKKLLALGTSDALILTEQLGYDSPDVFLVNQLQPDQQVAASELKLSQADLQLKLSHAARVPKLSFNTYYGRQQFRDDFGLSLNGEDWTNYSYMTLSLSVPIFTGFSTQSQIKQSRVGRKIALNDLRQTELESALNDAQLLADYQASLDHAQHAEEIFRLYDDNRKLARDRQREGLIGMDAYLTAFEDYLRAENAYLNALSEVYQQSSKIIPRISS